MPDAAEDDGAATIVVVVVKARVLLRGWWQQGITIGRERCHLLAQELCAALPVQNTVRLAVVNELALQWAT